MMNRKTIHSAVLSVLALAGIWMLSHAPAALAQAADVVCSQCVGKGDIFDKSITAEKVHGNSIFSSKIQDRSIQGVDIGLGAEGTAEIAADAVGSSGIAVNAVGADDAATGAVGSFEVEYYSLGAVDLSNEAGMYSASGSIETINTLL